MAKKYRRKPETVRWWIEFEHEEHGEVKVLCAWESTSRFGTYRIVPLAVEFDLFCPMDVQDRMTEDLMNVKMLGVTDG